MSLSPEDLLKFNVAELEFPPLTAEQKADLEKVSKEDIVNKASLINTAMFVVIVMLLEGDEEKATELVNRSLNFGIAAMKKGRVTH